MPTYGYQCTQCSHEFSVFQNMKDEPIKTCPECSGVVKRLLYPVGIVFKGSGWYVNDSRKPDTTEAGEKAAPAEAKDTANKTAPAVAAPAETTQPKPATATSDAKAS